MLMIYSYLCLKLLSTLPGAMWTYLDSPTAMLARELGAVPKFPPEHPKRVMLPVPKKLAFATWRKEGTKKREAEDCPVCTCKKTRWTDSLTDLDKFLLGVE